MTDADGRSLAGAKILTEPSPISEIAPSRSRSDGSFDLARYGLPPGRYTVTARLEGYQDASV
ncbi:MAG: carboxypeptidase regulatory-like domain-containing protein [Chloroflexi bacterium]|nr:carboxypeptidase regulatory-like domain-containing protein [Chloroflexota bacterium]